MATRDELERQALELTNRLVDDLVETSERVDFQAGTYLLAALAAALGERVQSRCWEQGAALEQDLGHGGGRGRDADYRRLALHGDHWGALGRVRQSARPGLSRALKRPGPARSFSPTRFMVRAAASVVEARRTATRGTDRHRCDLRSANE